MTKLYFIRHGESTANRMGLFVGHTDMDLTEKGHEQAEMTANYLKDIHIDVIYSSDLSRAYNTALHTAKLKGMEVIKSKNLREIYGGDWEGQLFDGLCEKYPEDYSLWLTNAGLATCTNGESVAGLQKRITDEVKRIVRENPEKSIAVFTHATPIRCLKAEWDKVPADKLKDIPWTTNASITYAEHDGCEFKITNYSFDEFMGDMVTALPNNV